MKFEHRITIKAPAGKIFSLYEDESAWASWDPDVKSSSINGKFETGVFGKLKPTNGPESKILFSEVIADKSFTVSSNLPFCKMTFDHELFAIELNTEVVHTVSFEGFLSPLFGRLIGRGINKGLPKTLRGLKNAVESKS